jgi:hypothetical protein
MSRGVDDIARDAGEYEIRPSTMRVVIADLQCTL